MAEPTPAASIRSQPVPLVPFRDRDRQSATLPTPLSSFVGREREVAAVVELLRQPGVRLVTLTGPGGVGKTRLALQAAADLLDAFPDGAWFVDLTPLADPTLVLTTIAGVLSVRDEAGRPPADALTDHLRGKQLLLVLDNCEHLLEAAPAVAELLRACPGLTVLATSRAPLRLRGEREVAVPPLGLPGGRREPPERICQYEAVRLFVERARDAKADFAVTDQTAPAVAEICRRLDGLPLALELAAARVKLFPPDALLHRLENRLPVLTGGARDAPARQRTLRDAIAWSYDLLAPAEQALFRRLAVFAGGVACDAAEAVADPGDELGIGVVEGLAALVDQSLLRQEDGPDGAPRFGMLETVREFGLERLAESGEEAAARDRHAAWCLALAEDAGAVLWRSEDTGVVERLEAEHPNLRAALGWLEQTGQFDDLLRLAAALGMFWYFAGHHREGRAWLEGALAKAPEAPSPARVRALNWAALVTIGRGDDEAVVRHEEQAAAMARQLGLLEDEAVAVMHLGIVLEDRGEYDAAEARLAAALALFREAGHLVFAAHATYHLGLVAYGRGEADRARAMWEEARATARVVGKPVVAAWCLELLGLLAAEEGDPGRAAAVLSAPVQERL